MKEKVQFDIAIEKFLNNIESLRSALPIVIKQVIKERNQANSDYQNFLKEECEFKKEENHYWISPENIRKWTDLKKEATSSTLSVSILNRSFLISLVSQFDTYVGDLMNCVFDKRPDLIDNSERQLTYLELKTFDKIDDARTFIIEKEIESVLRESHTEQFKWFEKKLKVKLHEDLPIWSTFIEVTQRRNLFVHNDGKVTSQYLNVCNQNSVPLNENIKLGIKLNSTTKYFEKAYNCFFEVALKLNQVLRRKLCPKEIELADKSFLNITFELVVNKQYSLAKELYDFAYKYIKNISKKDLELRIHLNRAQTYKWLGDNETCKKIIGENDWSATNDLFKLASQVLSDDFENAVSTMKLIGNNDKIINKAFYRDWPTFMEFRETTEFKKTYKEIYGEDNIIVEGTELNKDDAT